MALQNLLRYLWLLPRLLGLFLGIVVANYLVAYVRVLRARSRLPPGPFPLPIVGNYFSCPRYKPWYRFADMSKIYNSPLITIWNGHKAIICCNDGWVAHELIEKRAGEMSSRPDMLVFTDLTGSKGTNLVTLEYSERWRLHRKLLHAQIGTHKLASYRPFQINEGKLLMEDFLEHPDEFIESLDRYVTSIVSYLGWGRRIPLSTDYLVELGRKMLVVVDWWVPGHWFLETVPELGNLPSLIYPVPKIIYNQSAATRRYFLALAKESLKNKGEDHFSGRLLTQQEKLSLSDEEIAQFGFVMLGGGVDTTTSSMVSFVLGMCAFPEVQKKAQEEIDRLVGRDRTPNEQDVESQLPYVSALVQEVVRWRSVAIMGGIPHSSLKDQEYGGYFFPKGTWFFGNLWAIHRNPRDFPDPDRLEPERFIDGSEWKRPYPAPKGHNAFGWARRVCSGQYLAEQSMFVTILRILWAFTILPGLDEKGNEIKVDIFAYTSSQNWRPTPFKARFIPRGDKEKTVKMLKEEAKAARETLSQYDGESKLSVEQFA